MRLAFPAIAPFRTAVLAALLSHAVAAGPVRAQERAVPAIDDSPSTQQLLEQASDQARANPREAVRLLVEALDAGPDLVVRSPRDPDLFGSVGKRVHEMLSADPALRAAFRREVGPDAEELLGRGETERVFERRLDTEAGLRAAMALAESAMARGRFTQALACLERSADHDLLLPPLADRHAALLAEVRARLAVPAPNAFAPGTFERSFARDRWGQAWSTPLAPPDARGGPGPRSLPAVSGDRAFISDGRKVRAIDRFGGRELWESNFGAEQASPGLRLLAAGPEHIVTESNALPTGARPGSGGLTCIDPATGASRWTVTLDRLSPGRLLEGAFPHGSPILLDGDAVFAARKSSARFETSSILASVDLERPAPARWVRVIATSGSIVLGTGRASDSPVEHGGVIYLSTSTGAMAAVDAWDGRVRWIRRFPVPVRDRPEADEQFDAATPAIVRGRMFAVTPDRTRIVALDAADGSLLAELPTGVDDGVGGPAYVLGDDASGMVVVVGDRLVGIPALDPARVAWSLPTGSDLGPRGRVTVARTGDPAAPVIVVPGEAAAAVLDMRDGSEVVRIDWPAPANAVLAGSQLLAASDLMAAARMPVAEAQRFVRARMAGSALTEDAIALIELGRQVRDAALAVEGAEEALRRARRPGADGGDRGAARLELVRSLLAMDALDIGTDEQRSRIARALDESAEAAQVPELALLARAERALRGGRNADAARAAVELAFRAAPDSMFADDRSERCPDAAAMELLRMVRAKDPAAGAAASAAIDQALASAPAARRAECLRRAARFGAGTSAGDRALAAAVAALDGSQRAQAQLVSECIALGARPGDDVLGRLGRWRTAGWSPRQFARLGRAPGRIVEFRGRLVRRLPEARQPAGGILTMLDGDVAYRPAPSFGVAWRVPVGEDCTVIATEPEVIACDDSPGGTGRLVCIGTDGSVRWTASPRGASGDADPADASDEADPIAPALRMPAVIAMPTATSVVLLRRDGSLVAFDRGTGDLRWERAAGDPPPLSWTRSPLAVCVAESVDLGDGEVIRVVALDPTDGSAIGAWTMVGAVEVRWMRVTDGGLLVVATDNAIEARRLGGGDEERPYWRIDGIEATDSERGWSVGGSVAFVDSTKSLSAIDAVSGRIQSLVATIDPDDASMTRDVVAGPGWWMAFSREGAVIVSPDGRIVGRAAPGSDRVYSAAAVAEGRVLLLDDETGGEEPASLRSATLLHDLDVRAGGLERDPPILLKSLVRRIGAIEPIDGAIAVGNGFTVQVIEYPPATPPNAP